MTNELLKKCRAALRRADYYITESVISDYLSPDGASPAKLKLMDDMRELEDEIDAALRPCDPQ